MSTHNSHVTRISDSSKFNEICVNCGATDQYIDGGCELQKPCQKTPENGGITIGQFYAKDKKRRAESEKLCAKIE